MPRRRPLFASWFTYFGTVTRKAGPSSYERWSLTALRSAARRKAIPRSERLSRQELIARLRGPTDGAHR